MGPRLWLLGAMAALLLAAHLVEHELEQRRLRSARQRGGLDIAALLLPLEAPELPRIPGAQAPPALTSYVVREGDTLSGIAARVLGSARAYPILLELNRDRLPGPRALRAGMELRVPSPEWLRYQAERRRRQAATPSGGAARTGAEPAPPAPGPGPAGGTAAGSGAPGHAAVYVVQPGDTLGAIAQRLLGSVRHTRLLEEANRDVIRDPGRLQVGMRLRIPEPPP
ncbi:MAG: hypothetical protein KatS3mg102_1911 [Planctomycetota bacterium]|nr:MAG: hypothetical protein KatS3mg102_1911 [Planctomycetota bacterium]